MERFEILTNTAKATDERVRSLTGKNENELADEAAGEFLVFLAEDLAPTQNTWLKEAMNFVRLHTYRRGCR
jgi:hypothetical protein